MMTYIYLSYTVHMWASGFWSFSVGHILSLLSMSTPNVTQSFG